MHPAQEAHAPHPRSAVSSTPQPPSRETTSQVSDAGVRGSERVSGRQPAARTVPVVQVALQGSCEESFHRYMSAGLTPCLRALGLVLETRPTETG